MPERVGNKGDIDALLAGARRVIDEEVEGSRRSATASVPSWRARSMPSRDAAAG